MNRRTSILVALICSSSIATAQPAPGDPVPTEPAAIAPADLSAAEPTAATTAPTAAAPVLPPVADTPPAKPAKQVVSVSYDKGLRFATDDDAFSLRLGFRNQFRLTSTRPTEPNSQFASQFSIPRSRLSVDGHMFGGDTRYKLELGLGDLGSFSFVKDLYGDQRIASNVWLRAGQWKRPFNRQELVSDFASEFNERANTAGFVGGGRDLGVAIHNDYEKSPDGLEWVVGVFNGFSGGDDRPALTTVCTTNAMTGVTTCVNPTPSNFPADFGPAVVARAGYNHGGIKGYGEGDLEGGPLRIAIGGSYKIDLANLAKRNEATVTDNLSHGLQADLMLKVEGFSVELGAYMMKLKSADAAFGVLIEPGYFLVAKRAQLAARFAYAPIAGRDQLEFRAAFNYLWHDHAWKWATDVGVVQFTGTSATTMATDDPDIQVRSMLQLTL